MTNNEILKKAKQAGIKFDLYQMLSHNGRPMRIASCVTFPDGQVVRFIDRIPASLALRQAIEHRAWELQ